MNTDDRSETQFTPNKPCFTGPWLIRRGADSEPIRATIATHYSGLMWKEACMSVDSFPDNWTYAQARGV